jgi:hypothetical protein
MGSLVSQVRKVIGEIICLRGDLSHVKKSLLRLLMGRTEEMARV